MKRSFALSSILLLACSLAPSPSCGTTVKAAWFETDISPEIGTLVAGYGGNDVSVEKVDRLVASGLAVDDGERKALLVSLDLLGVDAPMLRELRRGCAEILSIPSEYVLITCTHTHGGPHTRQRNEGQYRRLDFSIDGGDIPGLDVAYLRMLRTRLYESVRKIAASEWRTAKVGFYSTQVDQNLNRRFTTADNCASFVAHRRMLQKIGTGTADKEFGLVVLLDPDTSAPVYVVGNYAAHPLAAHSPGNGGLRISSDYPGFFRRYVKSETGADAMFVQGACGDLIPRGDELGINAARRVGEALGEAAMASIIDVQRNSGRFVFEKPRLSAAIDSFTIPIAVRHRHEFDGDKVKLEIQCLSIGDVAFVGVPGELVNELGLEIKWHSPYRRTFIAYSATDYFGYISPANFLAAGGYEAQYQQFPSRDTLRLVALAADTLLATRAAAFPEDSPGAEPYPDCLRLPLVNLPGGVKATKFSQKEAK